MPPKPMPRGAHGKIKIDQLGPESFEASAYYRNSRGDLDRMRRRGGTKTEAKANLQAALLDIASKMKGSQVEPSDRVRKVVDLWADELKQHAEDGILSWDTVNNYIGCAKNHIVPNIGSLQICELVPGECDRLLKHLRRTRTLPIARFARVTLGQFCKFAIRNGGLTTNPVPDAEQLRTGWDDRPAKPKGITPEARKQLMEKLRRFVETKKFDKRGRSRGRNAKIWTLMPDILDAQVATGGRIGEIICITGDAINITEKKVTLNGHWGRIPREGMVILPGRKGNQPAITVVIPDGSLAMWRRLKLASGGGLIFTGRDGGLINLVQLIDHFREAFTACDRGDLTSHQMRKTTAKAMKASKLTDDDVARQLGNTKAVAKKHYLEEDHANPSAAAALEVLFEGQ